MKKWIALLLTVVLVVCLMAACGGKDSDETTANPTGTNVTTGGNATPPGGSGTEDVVSGADLYTDETLSATDGDLDVDYGTLPASDGDLDGNE